MILHDAGLGFRLQEDIGGRGGFVMDQVGTWRPQNEMGRSPRKRVVEYLGIYLIIPAEWRSEPTTSRFGGEMVEKIGHTSIVEILWR